jgi:hypothetical protein
MLMRTHERRKLIGWLLSPFNEDFWFGRKRKGKRKFNYGERGSSENGHFYLNVEQLIRCVSDKCVCVGCDRRRHSKKTGF